MKRTPALVALAVSMLATPAVAALTAVSASSSTTVAAEWCVNNPPTYIEDKYYIPGGTYCVPGP